MSNDPQDKIAELIHRELMKLPERAAPSTLMSRVLYRIEQRKRCWWRQPWTSWPFLAKMISLPSIIFCVVAPVAGLSLLSEFPLVDWGARHAGDVLRRLTPAWDFGAALANAFLLSLASIDQLWILVSAAVAFLMYLTCLAVGTVCFRVALQKR